MTRKIHDLKIDQDYLDNLLSGKKLSEIRLNDRDYQCGDWLSFKEYNYASAKSTEHIFKITHIHSGLGLKEGYVVLSVRCLGCRK